MTRIQANLILLLTAAIWGGGFVGQSTAMGSIEPFWFIGLRFLLGTVAILPFALREHFANPVPMTRARWTGFVMIGLSLFGGAAFQQVGLKSTSVTNSSFLTSLYIIFVPVMTVIFLRRRPHWVVWPSALLALFGIFLLSGGQLSALSLGDGLTIICALFWAVQIMLVGIHVGPSARPLTLSVVQFALCSACGLILGALTEPLSFAAVMSAWKEILYVGLLSSGGAFVLQVIGQRYTTASQAAIFLSSESLFGALFGAILLGETISGIGYFGCAAIFIAMLMVEIVPELTRSMRKTG